MGLKLDLKLLNLAEKMRLSTAGFSPQHQEGTLVVACRSGIYLYLCLSVLSFCHVRLHVCDRSDSVETLILVESLETLLSFFMKFNRPFNKIFFRGEEGFEL